ncbi:hypothetical protein [Nocardia rhizosphaerae]|uniref:Uncharacterized protein n=1 Tax=Nocardia rhizosphaerae TaxID=1691571 RepID=A0ABV8KZG9_9NOCA
MSTTLHIDVQACTSRLAANGAGTLAERLGYIEGTLESGARAAAEVAAALS